MCCAAFDVTQLLAACDADADVDADVDAALRWQLDAGKRLSKDSRLLLLEHHLRVWPAN